MAGARSTGIGIRNVSASPDVNESWSDRCKNASAIESQIGQMKIPRDLNFLIGIAHKYHPKVRAYTITTTMLCMRTVHIITILLQI